MNLPPNSDIESTLKLTGVPKMVFDVSPAALKAQCDAICYPNGPNVRIPVEYNLLNNDNGQYIAFIITPLIKS